MVGKKRGIQLHFSSSKDQDCTAHFWWFASWRTVTAVSKASPVERLCGEVFVYWTLAGMEWLSQIRNMLV